VVSQRLRNTGLYRVNLSWFLPAAELMPSLLCTCLWRNSDPWFCSAETYETCLQLYMNRVAFRQIDTYPTQRYFLTISSLAVSWPPYTGCPRRNVPDFGRVFLVLKYTDITQNTYIQSWTVTEIMSREVWNFDSCYSRIDYQIPIETGRNMWFL